MSTKESPVPSHHAVIAGTGRAGTTFLVDFLAACGLDVGGAKSDDSWYPRAQAGREIALDDETRPYVVKDPWLFSYCRALDLSNLTVDILIIPVRDLTEAASSRVHQERLGMIDAGWAHRSNVGVFGSTPGGVIYSVDIDDQRHLLAEGLHELVFWASQNRIPVCLLAFPRLVEDREYLIEMLQPWLAEHCSAEEAREAFDATSQPEKVNAFHGGRATTTPDGRGRYASEIRALTAKIKEQNSEIQSLGERLQHAEQKMVELGEDVHASQEAQRTSELEMGKDVERLSRELECARSELSEAHNLAHVMAQTRSWRWTAIFRGGER